jgi:hypothetical protein
MYHIDVAAANVWCDSLTPSLFVSSPIDLDSSKCGDGKPPIGCLPIEDTILLKPVFEFCLSTCFSTSTG